MDRKLFVWEMIQKQMDKKVDDRRLDGQKIKWIEDQMDRRLDGQKIR